MSGPLLSDLDENGQRGLLIISRGTAILLLGVYIAYLFFQLKTHASLFIPKKRSATLTTLTGDEPATVVEEEEEDVETVKMSVVAAGVG
jgi:Ca2+:H+ antiporter